MNQKIRPVNLLFIWVLVTFCLPTALLGQSADWMKTLPDQTALNTLSIPGTHDSGSTRGGKQLKTQTTTIEQQLEQGIRAFDIRLKKRKNQLGIYHSHAYQKITWEENVLPSMIRFLKAHPSEVLIVSLKREGGEQKDYESFLSASLKQPENQPYFVNDFHAGLTLKECRGKILFLHRDRVMEAYPGAACSNWRDNCTCELTLRNKDGKEGIALLEDEYQYQSGEESPLKIKACISNLKNVSQQSIQSPQWGITFISATGLPAGTPKVFADRVNPSIADFLEKEKVRNCGILFIDFVDDEAGRRIVNHLIHSNLETR